jgi:hypothetical protein
MSFSQKKKSVSKGSFSQKQKSFSAGSFSQRQGTAESVNCEGYLEKQTHSTIKRWLPRYFELQPDALRYYDAKGSTNLKGTIERAEIQAFDKFVEGDFFIMMLTLEDGKSIKLRARDEENAAKWKDSFSKIAGPGVNTRRARVEYWKSRASQMLTTSTASEALKARVKGKLKDLGEPAGSNTGSSMPTAPNRPAPPIPPKKKTSPSCAIDASTRGADCACATCTCYGRRRT